MPTAPPEPETRLPGSAWARGVIGVLLLAAALRLPTLGQQSFWFDEAVTVRLLHRGLGGMLSALPHSESTPPLYYFVAWFWARVFGIGEAGLRLLSAFAGIATVGVVAACGRRLGGTRVGLAAGLLAAVGPLLVWYSQEARSYALLTLLCAASLLAFLTAVEDGGARALLAWGVLSALALATHYFAVFLIAPETVWLLWRRRRSPGIVPAMALVAGTAIALAPLALAQRNTKNADFIGSSSFATRLLQVPKQLLVGYGAPGQTALGVAAGILTVAAIVCACRPGPEQRRALVPLALGVAALLLPLLLAALGLDYILSRNLIAAWVPFGLVVALGIARLGRVGQLALAGLAAVGLAVVIGIDVAPQYQRDNWRGAIHAATRGFRGPRAVVLNSTVGDQMFSVYAPGSRPLPSAGAPVREVDVLVIPFRQSGKGLVLPPLPAPTPVPGFHLTERRVTKTYALLRYRAPRPVRVTPALIGATSFPGGNHSFMLAP